MHRSRLCYLTLDSNDLEESERFWLGALGATPEPVDEASVGIYRRMRLPDSDLRLLLQLVPEVKVSKSRMHLDLEADDVEAEVQRLVELGATRDHLQEERGYRFWVMLDPSGNEFCVLQTVFADLLATGNTW
jgi:hypothetical protein